MDYAFFFIVGCALIIGFLLGVLGCHRVTDEALEAARKAIATNETLIQTCERQQEIMLEAKDRAKFFLRRCCFLAKRIDAKDWRIAKMREDVENGDTWKWRRKS